MVRTIKLLLLTLFAVTFFTGCNPKTIDQLYCLPKKSEEYTNLQSVIDSAMTSMEYCAPTAGEHQQNVQCADLDGDGIGEYLVFARGTGEKPLRIFIFTGSGQEFSLLDTIELSGTSFEQVEYIRMDNNSGFEIVVGCKLSDQLFRAVSVYTLRTDQLEQLFSVNYSKFLATDLNENGLSELMVLRPGSEDTAYGVAELFSAENSTVERSREVAMSEPAGHIKRIAKGGLSDGYNAVFVASSTGSDTIITDVYALVDGELTNVSLANATGTNVQTLRNYYIYADDIDSDGILELPGLIEMKLPEATAAAENQHLIRWFSMASDGTETDRLCTYHNFVGGWYLELDSALASRFCVIAKGSSYEFALWDEDFTQTQTLVTVYVLTGQKREEQALTDNRFVLHRTDSTVYAAKLEVASAAYGMSRDSMISSFHMILQDWNTGET